PRRRHFSSSPIRGSRCTLALSASWRISCARSSTSLERRCASCSGCASAIAPSATNASAKTARGVCIGAQLADRALPHPLPDATIPPSPPEQDLSMPTNGAAAQRATERDDEEGLYPIGEVSRIANVKAFVLRYWETEFPMLEPVKSSRGHRLYRQEDVDLVLRIKRLLYDEGFTIAGARRHLREPAGGTDGEHSSGSGRSGIGHDGMHSEHVPPLLN